MNTEKTRVCLFILALSKPKISSCRNLTETIHILFKSALSYYLCFKNVRSIASGKRNAGLPSYCH